MLLTRTAPLFVAPLSLLALALMGCADAEPASPSPSEPASSAGLSSDPSASSLPPPPPPPPPPAMAPLPTDWKAIGDREVGAACAFGAQCSSGVCSADGLVTGACGQCLDRRGLGERCDGPLQGCSGSARCLEGVCKSALKTLGEECGIYPKGGDRGECDDDLYCASSPANFEKGTCQARLPLGAACTSDYSGAQCPFGAVCDGGLCAPKRAAGLGASCKAQPCEEGLYCEYEAGQTCRPSELPKGAPCGVVDGEIVKGACEKGTVCGDLKWPDGGGGNETKSSCVPEPLEGEPCILGRCAPGLFCRASLMPDGSEQGLPRCERPGHEGEACNVDPGNYARVECEAGLECRAKRCQPACQ